MSEWYEWCLYATGATLSIIELSINHYWKPLGDSLVISSILSAVSLAASSSGGVAGIFKVQEGTGGQGLWIAIIAFAILFPINAAIFIHKVIVGYRHLMAHLAMKLETDGLATLKDCLIAGSVKALKRVQIII